MRIAIRFIALLAARVFGRMLAAARHPLTLNALVLITIVAALALLDAWATRAWPPADSVFAPLLRVRPSAAGFLTAQNTLAIYALLLIAWWVLRERRRLLITRFDDISLDKDKSAAAAHGISALLANELAQIKELFEEFEEGRVIKAGAGVATHADRRGFQLFAATAQMDAPSGFLEGAISAEAPLALGPLRIPVGVFTGLLNRVVQGPRLSGQVQVEGARRFVTVSLNTREVRRQWRIEDEAAGGVFRQASEVATEIACRMFGDLAFDRPVRWQAVAALHEALCVYRRTLRTAKDGRLNLLEAEKLLLTSIHEDNRFDLAHYNIGVVYVALGWLAAAQSAFGRAAELNPLRFSARYSLARVLFELAQQSGAPTLLSLALEHCARATELTGSAQDRALALSQKAQVQMALGGLEFFAASKSCRGAVNAAWRALLAAELALPWRFGVAPLAASEARELASQSLLLLALIAQIAVGISPQRHFIAWMLQRQRYSALRQAAWLTPDNYEALLGLGNLFLERGRLKPALSLLQRAVRLAPDRLEARCLLAIANARLFRVDETDVALLGAVDAFGGAPEEVHGMFDRLAEAMSALAERWQEIRARILGVPERLRGRSAAWRTIWAVPFVFGLGWEISGRRFTHWAGSMATLGEKIKDLATTIQELDSKIAARRADLKRVRRFRLRLKKIDELAGAEQDRSADLRRLHDAMAKTQVSWEAGHAAEALARIALAHGRNGEAIEWYRKSIATFEPLYPREIVRRGLRAGLAHALLEDHKLSEAFENARQAVIADPRNTFERMRLAVCHFEMKEWTAAREAWEESLRLQPDEPNFYCNLGLCWYNEANGTDQREKRRAALERAVANFELALKLDDDTSTRQDSQFLLGLVYSAMGRDDEALAVWQPLEGRDYAELYLGLSVADAMLRDISYREAEMRYRTLITKLEDAMAKQPQLTEELLPGRDGDPGRPRHILALAWAELGVALALARRAVAFDEALDHVERARVAAERTADEGDRTSWRGACDRVEGEVRVRKGDSQGSVAPLERSLKNSPAASGYVYLAQALFDMLDPASGDEGARRSALRIRSLAEQGESLDLAGEMDREIAMIHLCLETTTAGRALPPRAPSRLATGPN